MVELQCDECRAQVKFTLSEALSARRSGRRIYCASHAAPGKPLGTTVTIGCKKCGQEVIISVIKLSRLHHPPLCAACENSIGETK